MRLTTGLYLETQQDLIPIHWPTSPLGRFLLPHSVSSSCWPLVCWFVSLKQNYNIFNSSLLNFSQEIWQRLRYSDISGKWSGCPPTSYSPVACRASLHNGVFLIYCLHHTKESGPKWNSESELWKKPEANLKALLWAAQKTANWRSSQKNLRTGVQTGRQLQVG